MTAVQGRIGQFIFLLFVQSQPLPLLTTMGLDGSCCGRGTWSKRNRIELWLKLGGLRYGDLVGEERAERPQGVWGMQRFRWQLSPVSVGVTG